MSIYFLQWLASVLNSSFFYFGILHQCLTFFLCFHSLFLSIRFPFAFFQTFFNKVLHMKFHLSLYGNPIRSAERAPYGTLPGSWQDSHQWRMEYHVRYINYMLPCQDARPCTLEMKCYHRRPLWRVLKHVFFSFLIFKRI